MKIINLIALSGLTLIISCGETAEKKVVKEITINKTEVTVDVADSLKAGTFASLHIEGMSCEVGCARMIKKTVSDLNGVLNCDVAFEDKKATISFDDTAISEKEIIATIEDLHSNQYQVTEVEIEKRIVKEAEVSETTGETDAI